MTNWEKWKETIKGLKTYDWNFAVDKETGTPVSCIRFDCSKCLFGKRCKPATMIEWALSEYYLEVDWSNVPVDTKVLVSNDGKTWGKRYFAKYDDGKVYAWD